MPAAVRGPILRNERGAIGRALLVLLGIVAVAVITVGYVFGTVIEPDEIGVWQLSFGPNQGVSNHGLPPGYHWSLPFYSKVYVLPRSVRILNFHREQTAKEGDVSRGPLMVISAGRAAVDVDVTVFSRFYSEPGEEPAGQAGPEQASLRHGGPGDLLTKVGPRSEQWDARVQAVTEEALRVELGKLSTDQFYDPKLRQERVDAATDRMRAGLAEFGIAVEAVLVRRYTFQDDAIEDSIFQKNLEAQNRALAMATSGLTKEQQQTSKIQYEGEAAIQGERARGESESSVLRSQGDLTEAQSKAEGDLLVAQAKAEVDRLRAGALAQGGGAAVFVGRELAPVLGTLKGGVIGNIDPYDLEAWVKRMGGAPAQQPAR